MMDGSGQDKKSPTCVYSTVTVPQEEEEEEEEDKERE
jgi:hypothetical protein